MFLLGSVKIKSIWDIGRVPIKKLMHLGLQSIEGPNALRMVALYPF